MLAMISCSPVTALAQFGPVDHEGFLEYQLRLNDGEAMPSEVQQLATWRADFSTYAWRPWIFQFDASLGLTRTSTSQNESKQNGTLTTGGATARLFPHSSFPLRAFFESRDSRVDGDLSNFDLSTTTFGILQQYAPKGGGRFSVDYRQSDNTNLSGLDPRVPRNFVNRTWQFNASKSIGRNDLRLIAINRGVERRAFDESETRNTFNLRHRFRTSPRFFLEDTTFFADERIELDGSDMHRRFLQFNGISTWRPDTEKPLFVTVRALAQGVGSGPSGMDERSQTAILNASANYQMSPRITIAGNAGVTMLDPENDADTTTFFQRVRSSYRSRIFDLGGGEYVFGGTMEVGNRRDRDNGMDTIQDGVLTLNHGYSKLLPLSNHHQLQISFAQQVGSALDTDDREENTLNNSIFLTVDRQNGRTSSYVRLSVSDRRFSGDRDDVFQLANLQVSRRTQVNRFSSWNGSLTIQYSRTVSGALAMTEIDTVSASYSADLSYMRQDLFDVRQLNFRSELRFLSSNFRSDDPFDNRIGEVTDREDKVWRNRLEYRIGRLEMRVLADLREISDQWTSRIFFQIRRYYGQ